MLDCDITFNKNHGIELGCVRTTLRGCMITDNYGLALRLQQESAKLLLRINEKAGSHESQRPNVLRGKVGTEWREILPPYKEVRSKLNSKGESELSRMLEELQEEPPID